MNRMLFPRFSRKISAILSLTGTIVLWSCLAGLFVLNVIGAYLRPPGHKQAMVRVLLNPDNIPARIALAQSLWQEGFVRAAYRELTLVQQLLPASVVPPGEIQVLGAMSSTPAQLQGLWRGELYRLQQDFVYWNDIVRGKPDYVGAYWNLGALSYQLGKDNQARMYLQKALSLDPNNIQVRALLTAIGGK